MAQIKKNKIARYIKASGGLAAAERHLKNKSKAATLYLLELRSQQAHANAVRRKLIVSINAVLD